MTIRYATQSDDRTDLTPDLQYLVGEPLNAVNFVMDYVELLFNGSYLRCLSPPTVHRGDEHWAFPGAGSRDALCRLIGARVTAIRAVDGDELRVDFDDQSRLTSSLSHDGTAERLHFHDRRTDETQYW